MTKYLQRDGLVLRLSDREQRTEKVELIRDHTEDKHQFLDCEECPVCQWMLERRKQTEAEQ